LTVTYLNTQ